MKLQGNLYISGETHGINFTDGVTPFPRAAKLTFNQGGFYLSPTSDGSPQVNLKGVSVNDGVSNFAGVTSIGFSQNFYLSGSNSQKPTVNLRNPFFKSISLEFPGASENIMIFRAHEAMRILSCRAVLVGSASPSVTFQIKSGSDRSNLTASHTVSTAVTSTTTGVNVGLATTVIPAGSFVCLVTTAQSGTVTEMDVSMQVEFV